MGAGGAGGMKGLLATGLLFAGLGHGQNGHIDKNGDCMPIGATCIVNQDQWMPNGGCSKETLTKLDTSTSPVLGMWWPDESYVQFRGSGTNEVQHLVVVVCRDKQHFCTLDEKNNEHKINLIHTEYMDGQFIHQGDFVEIYCPEIECPDGITSNGSLATLDVSAPKPILTWRDDMPLWTLFVNHKREFYIELDIRDRRGGMYTLSRDDSALVGDFDDLQAAKDYAEKLVLSGKP